MVRSGCLYPITWFLFGSTHYRSSETWYESNWYACMFYRVTQRDMKHCFIVTLSCLSVYCQGYRMVKASLCEIPRQGMFFSSLRRFFTDFLCFQNSRLLRLLFSKKTDFETREIWPKFCETLDFLRGPFNAPIILSYVSAMYLDVIVNRVVTSPVDY